MLSGQTPTRQWNTRRSEKARRLASVPVQGKVLPTGDLVAMLEKLIAPGDKVVLEGNNQKQADFLSRSLAEVNPQIVHDLHMIMPSVAAANIWTSLRKASPASWTSPSPVRKACESPNCWRMVSSKSGRFTPTSNSTHVYTSTYRQTWR